MLILLISSLNIKGNTYLSEELIYKFTKTYFYGRLFSLFIFENTVD